MGVPVYHAACYAKCFRQPQGPARPAKWKGWCYHCARRILVGDQIRWTRAPHFSAPPARPAGFFFQEGDYWPGDTVLTWDAEGVVRTVRLNSLNEWERI